MKVRTISREKNAKFQSLPVVYLCDQLLAEVTRVLGQSPAAIARVLNQQKGVFIVSVASGEMDIPAKHYVLEIGKKLIWREPDFVIRQTDYRDTHLHFMKPIPIAHC